jgi:hypothetical protein
MAEYLAQQVSGDTGADATSGTATAAAGSTAEGWKVEDRGDGAGASSENKSPSKKAPGRRAKLLGYLSSSKKQPGK